MYFCTTSDPHRKTNAAVLVGQFCVLHLGRSADEAYRPLLPLKPFAPFRDASCGPSTYHLTVLDCLRGSQRARDAGLLDFKAPPRALLPTTAPPSPKVPPSPGAQGPAPPPQPAPGGFDAELYEHFERVENGDLNWVVPGKLVAFSGPHGRKATWAGYHSLTPEDYWAPFRSFGVTAVVRLNKRLYDRRRFTEGGFRHHEIFFPDGSCPTPQLVERFCSLVEAEPGVVAVHCKAGLGRTGVLIGLFLMKHFSFTANEALGYLRLVRPGSVIGPQQHFLRDWERRMHAAGDAYRAGVAPRPARLPQPRRSFGAGGEYDDGDISDEDADPGDEAEAAYDDGGYTTNRAVAAANAAANAAASAAAAAAAAAASAPAPHAPFTQAQVSSVAATSPTKAGHSGTVARVAPSLLSGGGTASMPLPSGAAERAAARAAAGQIGAALGASAAVPQGVPPSRTTTLPQGGAAGRSAAGVPSSVSAGISPVGGGAASQLHRGASLSPPPPAHRAAIPPRGGSGGTTVAGASSTPPPSSGLSAASSASPGVVERLRRSVMGSPPPPPAASNGLRSSTGPLFRSLPADPESELLRTISGMAPASPPNAGVARLVNAAGQPRKAPAAAVSSGQLYAGAFLPDGSPAHAGSGGAAAAAAQVQALDIAEQR